MLAKTACFAALVASASAFSAGPALPLRQTQVCIPGLCIHPLFIRNAATAQRLGPMESLEGEGRGSRDTRGSAAARASTDEADGNEKREKGSHY